MSDQKNLIIAIAVSVAIMLGFQFFVEAPKQERLRQQQAASQAVNPGAANPGAAGSTAPTPGTQAGTQPGSSQLPALPAAPGAGLAQSREAALAQSPRVTVDGLRLRGSINLVGGRIDDVILPDYRETIDPKSPAITLFSPAGAPHGYYAEFGWTAGPGASVKLPGSQTLWSADKTTLKSDDKVTLRWDNGEGLVFTRVIALDRDFLFTVTQGVENKTDKPVTLFPYGLLSRHGTPKTDGLYILHEGPLGVFHAKADEKATLKELKYSDMAKEDPIEVDSIGGWLGFTDKYWLASLVPGVQQTVKARFSHSNVNGLDRYQADWLGGGVTVAANSALQSESLLYAGAKQTRLLDRYEEQKNIPRFELAIDWGWFHFLTKPFFFAIDWIHGVVGSIGIAMLIFTVVVKLLFFPLAYKSYVAMSSMKKLQPEMQKLRERYADNREQMQKELMELYKREKVNPAAGCLPILLQIPVFFSLYKVLYITIEMRHAPFYGWIKDLSAPDPTSWINLFGLLPYDVPAIFALGGMLHIVSLGIWPIIMGITMWLQMRLNPQPPDPVQAKIFGLMPIIFTFMLGSFASGLVIYWSWNNTLSIIQQMVIMRRMGVKIGGGADPDAAKPAAGKAKK